MSDTAQIDIAKIDNVSSELPQPMLLARYRGKALVPHLGALTPAFYSDVRQELSALTSAAGVYDRGHRVRVRITGGDRVRWLNGMVTNSIKALTPGEHSYTFILNAQGRIQGDAQVFALEDSLILETDRSQLARLLAHFERFIIMDDVELAEMPGTTLGLAGQVPSARIPAPALSRFADAKIAGADVTIANITLDPAYPRYDVWVAEDNGESLWAHLLALGCTPCGVEAGEALRVLEGVPLYGVDIHEKTLAQETGQARALNFSKGCYLGQEIVERIRSRATIHRSVRQFVLEGELPTPGTALTDEGTPAGELSSVAAIDLPWFAGTLALGTVRNETLERAGVLTYAGGTARALTTPPRP